MKGGAEADRRFRRAAGETLRRIRRGRGLTLRAISLERFWDLARFYEVPPDRLLADIANAIDPAARAELVIDLTKLPLIDAPARRSVSEFANEVRSKRGDHLSDVITLRSGDLEVIAYAMDATPRTVADRLAPAVRRSAPS